MHPRTRFTAFALALLAASVITPARAKELPPAREIHSVWTVGMQPCNGVHVNAQHRAPDEARIKREKQVDLPRLGLRFRVPQLPGTDETIVKIRLDDRSRGVVDHYLLLAKGDLNVPFAAIVVTELPADILTREAAFDAARTVEAGLARRMPEFTPAFHEIDGPHGPALEMIVPGRNSTHCFPTSEFVASPAGVDTIGITRFAYLDGRLVEFAIILEVDPEETAAAREAFARSVMDGFWTSLSPL